MSSTRGSRSSDDTNPHGEHPLAHGQWNTRTGFATKDLAVEFRLKRLGKVYEGLGRWASLPCAPCRVVPSHLVSLVGLGVEGNQGLYLPRSRQK